MEPIAEPMARGMAPAIAGAIAEGIGTRDGQAKPSHYLHLTVVFLGGYSNHQSHGYLPAGAQ